MVRLRPLVAVLLVAGAVQAGGAGAALGGGGGAPGARDPLERAAPEAVAIPFAHRAGERWRLLLERREVSDGREGPPVLTELEAQALSPYGRDLLVDLLWLTLTQDGRRQPLWPRSGSNAALLDARGGGRLLLRVDRTGSAVAVLNALEARAALSRAHGHTLSEAEWRTAGGALLEPWNVAYRACGVALVPGQVTRRTLEGAGLPGGEDTRVLRLEPSGAAIVLALTALTTYGRVEEPGGAVREDLSARFDPVSARLWGGCTVERREATRRIGERVTFREAPVPAAQEPLALR